ERWKELAPSPERGTLLMIRRLNDNQPAFAAFQTYFRRYCANVYHMFLDDKRRQLVLIVNGETLAPVDPLFTAEAQKNGPLENPLVWDGKTVRQLLTDTPLNLNESAQASVAATHLVHPPSFAAEGKTDEVRDHYQINPDP